jgi:hypothetical protein
MTDYDDPICDQLSAWMDGELPEPQARSLARLLESDPQLQAQLAGLQAVGDLLGSLPRHRAPEDLAQRVLESHERQALAETRTPPSTAAVADLRTAKAIAVAAVVLISLGLGVLTTIWISRTGQGQPAPDGVARTDGPGSSEPATGGQGRGKPDQPTAGGDEAHRLPGESLGPVRGAGSEGVLLVVIRTEDPASTNRQVVDTVLRANGLIPESRAVRDGALYWKVAVPQHRLGRIKQALSSLPSRVVAIRDADLEESRSYLSLTGSGLTPEQRAQFVDLAAQADAPGTDRQDPPDPPKPAGQHDARDDAEGSRRIAELLDQSRRLVRSGPGRQEEPAEPAPARAIDPAPESGPIQPVRPVIIKIIDSSPPETP